MSEYLDLVAKDRITFSLYSPATGCRVFVSNDKIGGDNVIEAHPYQETRNIFVLEQAGDSHYRIRNCQYNKYLFVSNDRTLLLVGDRVVEAHDKAFSYEPRNLFQFELLANGNYRICNPATQCYLVVSNCKMGQDYVIGGHGGEYKGDPRSEFQLLVNYNYKRWMELNSGLSNKRLAEICLPASHDSGTFNLRWEIAETDKIYATIKKICDAVDAGLQSVGSFLPYPPGQWVRNEILFPLMVDLGSATSKNIADQLADGIRCLDLRVCYDAKTEDFYIYHGLFGPRLSDILESIRAFLVSTRGELLYVTVGHFEHIPEDASSIWENLRSMFSSSLGDYAFRPTYEGDTVANNPFEMTLGEILGNGSNETGSKVILVAGGANGLGPGLFFPSPYSPPNNTDRGTVIAGQYTDTVSRDKMLEEQAENFQKNHGKLPFALYLTLTPDEISAAEIAAYKVVQKLQAAIDFFLIPQWVIGDITRIILGFKTAEGLLWSDLRGLSRIANYELEETINQHFEAVGSKVNQISFLYVDYYEDTLAVDIAIALSGGSSDAGVDEDIA